MGRFFYSLLTAFFVGVDGSLQVLLIPNSRLSRKVDKNPLMRLGHLKVRLADRNTAKSHYFKRNSNLGVNSVALIWVKKRLNRNIKGVSRIFKCPENGCNYLIAR
jgi:hypothetical protein